MNYRVHDFVGLRSAVELPDFEPFGVEDSGREQPKNADIPVVTVERTTPEFDRSSRRRVQGQYFWDGESSLIADRSFGARVELRDLHDDPTVRANDRYRRFGDFDALVRAVVQYHLCRQGATLVHAAACESPAGDGVLVFGPPMCGKSTTAALLAAEHGWKLLGDDRVVVTGSAVYAFPRPFGLRADSPLHEYESVRRARDAAYSTAELAVRRHLGAWMEPLRPAFKRFYDLSVSDQISLPLSAFGEVTERTSLDAVVFLHHDADATGAALESLPSAEASRSGRLLDWVTRGRDVRQGVANHYYHLDPSVDDSHVLETPEGVVESAVEGASTYRLRGERTSFVDCLADTFDG